MLFEAITPAALPVHARPGRSRLARQTRTNEPRSTGIPRVSVSVSDRDAGRVGRCWRGGGVAPAAAFVADPRQRLVVHARRAPAHDVAATELEALHDAPPRVDELEARVVVDVAERVHDDEPALDEAPRAAPRGEV